MVGTLRRVLEALVPILMFFICAFAQVSCSCTTTPAQTPVHGVIACVPQHKTLAVAMPSGAETIVAGAVPVAPSISSMGELTLAMPLVTVPGRAGVEPSLGVVYSSAGGDGVLGLGFSLSSSSAVSRCPNTLGQDREIRGVRFDEKDHFCLDGRRLVTIAEQANVVEYRTLPDTFVKVVGHFVGAVPDYFEVFAPSGMVVEYGKGDGTKPLALGGVPRVWLASKMHDQRGNAMTYGYCFAEAEGYTAEYALDEIRYTSFEGSVPMEAQRAVKLVYGTKDPEDIRKYYAAGMELQSALSLDEILMVGPGEKLVRRYDFAYELSPTTRRTLLKEVKECGADNTCKPPTRFQYSSHAPGFKRIATGLAEPTSKLASPLLADIGGDGLDDLLVPDTNKALSTPQNPITEWNLARNLGKSLFAQPTLAFSQDWPMVADPSGPSDPTLMQPDVGTAIDYNQDGLTDIWLHDVYGNSTNEEILIAQADQTFQRLTTDVKKPFALAAAPKPPTLTSAGASVHSADLDGDGVSDRIQCSDSTGAAGQAVWMAHLWKPGGFSMQGAEIEPLAGFRCDVEFYTVDVNADGKIEMVVPTMLSLGGSDKKPGATYSALSRMADGSYELTDTKLRLIAPGGRVVFLDVNGDGLPDAVMSGFSDHTLHTYINDGRSFAQLDTKSLAWDGIGAQDTFFHLAAPLDYDTDGRADLLMAIPAGMNPNPSDERPAWFILRATGKPEGPSFEFVDAKIPFEPLLGEAIMLADPRGPRIGDVNGDGAGDVVLVLDHQFNVFENLAADQDLLVAVSDGMNEHEPGEPEFVPNIEISYDHLTGDSYRAHVDPTNGCEYPRRCAIGPRRIVTGYALNDGEGGQRKFAIRYEDGRYDRLRDGFLGYAKRITKDLDTGAGTIDFYDNSTFVESGDVRTYPFAGQIQRQWQFSPGLSMQPKPEQIEFSFLDTTPLFVPTNDGKTFFTIPVKRRIRRAQGIFPPPNDPDATVEAYIASVDANGGATILRDTTANILDFDDFSNVLVTDVTTVGVDLTQHVEWTYKNDTARWVLGQLQTQEECSAAAGQSLCRSVTLTTNDFGEVETEQTASDDGSAETKLNVVYGRDDFGNITSVTAKDEFGHTRVSTTVYEPEGVFPDHYIDAADHLTKVKFDAGLGVPRTQTDPNSLVTTWDYDGLGRLRSETRPDNTKTMVKLDRSKQGGAWRVTQRQTTSGGADDIAEFDGLGRTIRMSWFGPDTVDSVGLPERIKQEILYDRLSGLVARRTVPNSESTPPDQLLFYQYEYDCIGRLVRQTTPWKATTETSYQGLFVETTDPLLKKTVVTNDALGRPLSILDAKGGTTSYTYGPFGAIYTVTDPGHAIVRTTRDAFGRPRKLEDPDRGTTILVHDGFGELRNSSDALGRVVTLEYDALGRPTSRTDKNGAEVATTSWTWDTAPNGIGKLHKLANPDGEKTYAYDNLGRMETLSLAINGESALLSAGLTYDNFGNVETISYPTPNGAAPFVVAQDYDAHGFMVAAKENATGFAYWRLTDVDKAGRFRKEVFGNDVSTERSYFADKQALKGILTQHGGTTIQKLGYDYDARLNLTSRIDSLQPQNTTERFRYDALERVTCAYFSINENNAAPCASSFDYALNGNLTFKSDVGVLSYGDAAHPHAVTAAGGGSYGYNAVGNQSTRPGGAIVKYTPFDLPKSITQGSNTVTFGYDGDEQRIRKTTTKEETLYFGDLYERIEDLAAGTMEHRYYVQSPERLIAIVTRGGAAPGTRYVHVDHLGSVESVTGDAGAVAEKRSYDVFGARRNPNWGQANPPSFTSKTSKGFTGHEGDDELGLINAKGRIYDPKIARFLSVDPIISHPHFGQSFNAYSYVLNNPLNLTDPSGFEDDGKDHSPARMITWVEESPGAEYPFRMMGLIIPDGVTPIAGLWASVEQASQVGAAAAPADVDTTGSDSGYGVGDSTSEPEESFAQNPYIQREGGFLAGLLLGLVPYAGLGEQLAEMGGVLNPASPEARFGMAFGLVLGGTFAAIEGAAGSALGGTLSATGIGALIGVPAVVVSATIVAGGFANIEAGISMMSGASSGSGGSSGTNGRVGAKRGPKTDENAPHNAKVREEAAKLRAEGNDIVAGGRELPEKLVRTKGGIKSGRRPDITYRTPSGELRSRNVGRTNADGMPVKREVEALQDLNGPGGRPTDFAPYD